MKYNQNVAQDREMEKAVVDYLCSQPDFFRRNADLLAELHIPHEAGNAVSLIERQVATLRDKNLALRLQLQELVEIARDNDRLNQRLHQLTVALLAVESREGMAELLTKVLHDDFAADAVTVHLFAPQAAGGEELTGEWDELLKHVNDASVRCGRLPVEYLALLFGEMAESIGSVALVALGPHGLLAIGSHDDDRFHEHIATDYLTRIGEVIAGMLRRLP